MMFPVTIHATNLDDAWHQALYRCFQFGHRYEITHGSYAGQDRYEFDFVTVHIDAPPAGENGEYLVPLMPEGSGLTPPTSKEYVESYFARYLMSDEKTDKEDYTYGERLNNPCLRPLTRPELGKPHILGGERMRIETQIPEAGVVYMAPDDNTPIVIKSPISQIDQVVRMFAETGPGTNQATMAIGMPWDILLWDPPCLRTIDCRIRYGKLHFFVYFRSWDLYSGFPANLGGLELLKQYMVDEIKSRPDTKCPDLENGQIIAASKGLHIYTQYVEIVETRFGRKYDEIRSLGDNMKNKGIKGYTVGA